MDTVICEPTLVHGETRTHERDCVFSPDGRSLYYLSDRGDTSMVMKAEPEDPFKPWWENSSFRKTVVVDGGGQRQLLSISPDGRYLAWQDPCGVFTFATTNGAVVSRGPAATQGGGYAWSPTGEWVVAQQADEFANFDVWIISVEGKISPYNLSRSFKYDGEPAWSDDGKVIAFVSERPELGDGKFLRYVYLDRAIEEVETYVYELDKSRRLIRDGALDKSRYSALELPGESFVAKEGALIDFDNLAERVRTVKTRASAPFFSWDSRTIAYSDGIATRTVHVPDRLQGEKLFRCVGVARDWVEKDNRVLWMVDRLPAIGERKLAFDVYQNTDYEDYQELAFRSAWARIRDVYYDEKTHGADWPGIGKRFLQPARHASSYSVFIRVMNMMLGELDSSHLGFYANDNSNREWARKTPMTGWNEVTAHIGLRFEPESAPDGWIVRDVIPGGPADRFGFDIRQGDVVVAIDGTGVGGGIDPTSVLNGPANRKVRVSLRRPGGEEKTVVVTSCSFADARVKIGMEELRAKRELVHKKTGGRLGYLNVDAMNWESFWTFQYDVFSEGYGRDGLIMYATITAVSPPTRCCRFFAAATILAPSRARAVQGISSATGAGRCGRNRLWCCATRTPVRMAKSFRTQSKPSSAANLLAARRAAASSEHTIRRCSTWGVSAMRDTAGSCLTARIWSTTVPSQISRWTTCPAISTAASTASWKRRWKCSLRRWRSGSRPIRLLISGIPAEGGGQ